MTNFLLFVLSALIGAIVATWGLTPESWWFWLITVPFIIILSVLVKVPKKAAISNLSNFEWYDSSIGVIQRKVINMSIVDAGYFYWIIKRHGDKFNLALYGTSSKHFQVIAENVPTLKECKELAAKEDYQAPTAIYTIACIGLSVVLVVSYYITRDFIGVL